MNSLPVKILTAILTFAIGVAAAGLWLTRWFDPVIEPVAIQQPVARLEMVFVLDTTGSMGGLIEGAKQRIWGIVNEVMQESHSSVRIGLVAYRDRGDEYVTQVLPLTADLDQVYTSLMNYEATGGGDEAEDVRTALADGVYKAGWSTVSSDLAQIIFLVGDAPPHNDYANSTDTLTTAASAVRRGIIVNTIQCGTMGETTRAWHAIAKRGNGQYFAIANDGGVQAITSPYDDEMGYLSNQLGSTFVPYGFGDGAAGEAGRVALAREKAAIEARVESAAPSVAKAERAMNKAISAEAYVGDLLQSLENGSVKFETIDQANLPAQLRRLPSADLKLELESRLAERRELRSQILALSKQREDYVKTERKKGGKEEGFDTVVAKTVKAQMARKTVK